MWKKITITRKIIKLLSLINKLQKYFYYNSSSEYLSVKGAEKLHVPSSGLVDLMLDIVKTVCSIVENLGDYEGTFPRRSKLLWFLLIHSEN